MLNRTTSIQQVLEVLPRAIKQEKQEHPNWKGKSKLSLCADDLFLYIENSKDSTKQIQD